MKPKLRPHRNGGGLVADFVEIARKTRVEPPAKVSEQAEVSGTGLIKGESWVHGYALVSDSPTIEDSDVRAYSIITGSPFIKQALVDEHAVISGRPSITQSMLAGTARIQDDAVINRSIIDGNALVSRDALIQNSGLHGNVVVIGGEVHDTNLDGNIRVHEGIWHRAPRHLNHPSLPMALTECINGHVIIGCLCRSVSWWKQNDKKMQAEYAWTDEAVKFIWDNIDWVAFGDNNEKEDAQVLPHLHEVPTLMAQLQEAS